MDFFIIVSLLVRKYTIFVTNDTAMVKIKEGFVGESSIVLPKAVVDMESSDPLVSSLYITDMGYYPNAENHYVERKKPISQYILIYCVRGMGWYTLGDNRYEVCENQYFILPAYRTHSYGSDENNPWTIFWVHFNGAHAKIYSEGAETPHDVKPSIKSRISDRNNLFDEIFNTLKSGYYRENLRYASSMLHYYLASMRYLRLYRNNQPHNELIDSDDMVSALIHFMKENIGKKLSLTEMAKYIGYSVSHMSMIFKRETKHSPTSYFNILKIHKACELLENTDLKINSICHKVGINDEYYFSRLFKNIIGESPKKYRKSRR